MCKKRYTQDELADELDKVPAGEMLQVLSQCDAKTLAAIAACLAQAQAAAQARVGEWRRVG